MFCWLLVAAAIVAVSGAPAVTAELTADETVAINTIVHELAGTSELV